MCIRDRSKSCAHSDRDSETKTHMDIEKKRERELNRPIYLRQSKKTNCNFGDYTNRLTIPYTENT